MNSLLALGIALGLLALVIAVIFWLVAMVDCVLWPIAAYEATEQNRAACTVLIAGLGPLGAVIYWVTVRPRLRATGMGRW